MDLALTLTKHHYALIISILACIIFLDSACILPLHSAYILPQDPASALPMDAALCIDLIPPRVNDHLSYLTPHAYIRDIALLSSIREKSPFHISSRAQKAAILDPLPLKSDANIIEYQSRTHQLLGDDRRNLRILVPVNKDMIEGLSDVRHRSYDEDQYCNVALGISQSLRGFESWSNTT